MKTVPINGFRRVTCYILCMFFMQVTSPQYLNAFKWWIGELSGLFNISHVQFLLLSSPKWENVCRGVFYFGLWPLFFLFCKIHFCSYFLSFGNNQRLSEPLSVAEVWFETPVRIRAWSSWFPSGSCCYWLIFTHNHVLASELPKTKN